MSIRVLRDFEDFRGQISQGQDFGNGNVRDFRDFCVRVRRYDFFEWRYEGQHFTVQVMCEGQTTFPTKSKTYCPTNNLDINTEDMAETAPQIVDDLCWKKCNSDTPGSHCEGHANCIRTSSMCRIVI